MKIEVFLNHIFQEFPGSNEENLDSISTKGWPTKGGCPCRGGGICKIPLDIIKVGISNVFVRAEDFGGLLFDPLTSAVFKLDNEAFVFIDELQKNPNDQHLPIESLAQKYTIESNKLRSFIIDLQEFELWPK